MNASAADFGDSFDKLPDWWHSAFAEGDSIDNNQISPSKAKGAPTKGWGVRLFGFGARKEEEIHKAQEEKEALKRKAAEEEAQ
jgi:hypothetical protein